MPEREGEEISASFRAGRVVVIDCETTGLSWRNGDRIVSLAGIEMVYGKIERGFSLVFNPGCPSHPAATRVHGFSDIFLAQQEGFSVHGKTIREFIGDSVIVGHNVTFDIGFLNNELRLAGNSEVAENTLCTMSLFRSRYPGRKASLDACCDLYGLNRSGRAKYHGAFTDAALTASLFWGLTDGRNPPFEIPLAEVMAPTNAIGSPGAAGR